MKTTKFRNIPWKSNNVRFQYSRRSKNGRVHIELSPSHRDKEHWYLHYYWDKNGHHQHTVAMWGPAMRQWLLGELEVDGYDDFVEVIKACRFTPETELVTLPHEHSKFSFKP